MSLAPQHTTWARLRSTFGPVVAGLLGGGLLGLAGLHATAALHTNVARSYAKFPSLPAPSVAWDFEVPQVVSLAALVVGLGAALLTGAFAVYLAGPRDLWEDVSAGVTAALAATLAAFVSGIGWAVVLACVVVPSISDLTLVTSSKQPAVDLAERYPDLHDVEPEERGGAFMAKIVSDQVDGSAKAATLGILASFLTMGTLAFAGTLAAGALRRRNEPLTRVILPYFEITGPMAVSLFSGLTVAATAVYGTLLRENPLDNGLIQVLGLVAISGVIITAAIRRWPWVLRLCLALTWLVWLVYAHKGPVGWVLIGVTALLTGFLVIRFARAAAPKVAAPAP
jgi:hypothetical protein